MQREYRTRQQLNSLCCQDQGAVQNGGVHVKKAGNVYAPLLMLAGVNVMKEGSATSISIHTLVTAELLKLVELKFGAGGWLETINGEIVGTNFTLERGANLIWRPLTGGEYDHFFNVAGPGGASSSAAAGNLSATPSGLSRHFARQEEVLVAVHDGVDELRSTILKLEKGVAEAKEEAAKANGQIAIMERRQLDDTFALRVVHLSGQCISRSSKCSAAGVVVPSPQALLYRLAVNQLIPAVNMGYQLGTSQPHSADFILAVVGILNVVVMGVFLLLAAFGRTADSRRKWFIFISGSVLGHHPPPTGIKNGGVHVKKAGNVYAPLLMLAGVNVMKEGSATSISIHTLVTAELLKLVELKFGAGGWLETINGEIVGTNFTLERGANLIWRPLTGGEYDHFFNVAGPGGASSSAAAGNLSATPSGLSRHFARQEEVLVAVHDGVDELRSTILKLEKGVAEAKEEAAKANGQIAIMERRQLD
ncbi:hypothetical protein QJQ45_026298, partial [Haematococcus lacustris]